MDEARKEIADLGEFGLIDHLTRDNETVQAGTMLSIGDDAAVIDTFGKQTVITTDMLLEGVHFDLMYTPLRYLGYKAVAVNLSDIYAMNAAPTQITIGIGVSNKFSVQALEEFYEGVYAACEKYNVDVVGGDTCTSLRGFVISVTALGVTEPEEYVTRAGAQKGDLICVSGDLGAAYAGLQILEREKKIFLETKGLQPELAGKDYVIQRLLRPEPRADIIEWLRDNHIKPTSMIDISDGLSSELFHICKQSQVSCTIYEDKIPVHDTTRETAFELNIDPTMCALNGGEDYEILFTIKQEDYEKITLSEQISVIGHITDEGDKIKLVSKSGNEHELKAQGWKAFNK